MSSIKRERPYPKHHFKVAVYIRYFNQTKYEDYLSVHKKQFLDTLALCPNWEFVDFYMVLSFQATMAQEESHTRSRSMETFLRMRLDGGLPLTPKLLGYGA